MRLRPAALHVFALVIAPMFLPSSSAQALAFAADAGAVANSETSGFERVSSPTVGDLPAGVAVHSSDDSLFKGHPSRSILRWVDDSQMSWVAACSITTHMVEHKAMRDRASAQTVGGDMCAEWCALKRNSRVTVRSDVAGIRPTLVRSIHRAQNVSLKNCQPIAISHDRNLVTTHVRYKPPPNGTRTTFARPRTSGGFFLPFTEDLTRG